MVTSTASLLVEKEGRSRKRKDISFFFQATYCWLIPFELCLDFDLFEQGCASQS